MRCLTLLLLILAGCKIPDSKVVSITQSLIGIRIGQNPASQTPEFQLGFFRATFQVVPTSTNILYTPIVNSSLSMDQKAFSTSIDETFLAGGAQDSPDSVAKTGAMMRLKSPKLRPQ